MTDRVRELWNCDRCDHATYFGACPHCGYPKPAGPASSNRAALEAEMLECLDANESDSAATLQARARRAREIRRELDAIPNSAADCPHGCKKATDCLRYNQGGSIPADCALLSWQAHTDATRNSVAGPFPWRLDADDFAYTAVCGICGAMVARKAQPLHEAWHRG